MGKKYIVEIGRLERLYKAFIGAHRKPEITWLSPEVDLTPYTEPDMEQVKEEAYQKGYEQGYKDGYNEPGKGKIQVGDEVNLKCGVSPAIYMQGTNGSDEIYLLFNDGSCGIHGRDEIECKTGRHFPEIAEVLQKMKES